MKNARSAFGVKTKPRQPKLNHWRPACGAPDPADIPGTSAQPSKGTDSHAAQQHSDSTTKKAGKTEATIYYDVIEKISTQMWKKFARLKLGLRDAEIEAIECDYSNNILEQKYQMVRRWKTKNDKLDANELVRLCEDFISGDYNSGLQSDIACNPIPAKLGTKLPGANETSCPGVDEYSLKQKCEKLKSALKDKIRSSLADFSQRPVAAAKMAVVTERPQIGDAFQNKGHFHRRDDIGALQENPFSELDANDMFHLAKKTATDEATSRFKLLEKAKQEYVQKHGNTVGVIGQAGMGKTTSSKNWALEALEGNVFGHVSFIFYIVVRFVDFETKMSLLEFLLHTTLPDWKCRRTEANSIMKVIKSDKDVLLIVDGLDEAPFEAISKELSSRRLPIKAKSEVFLKSLAGGDLLPNARKVFTSRPTQFYRLPQSHRPSFVVQMLGMDAESRRDLLEQMGYAQYDSIQKTLRTKVNLSAQCYVPVNFLLICHYLASYVDYDSDSVSLSRVFAFACANYFHPKSLRTHSSADESLLCRLARLAWHGFRNKQILFQADDFEMSDIAKTTVSDLSNDSLLVEGNQKLTLLDGHCWGKYFCHLVWQEFLAAVYLMMIMPLEEFSKQTKQLCKARWEIVAKFAFGICDSLVYSNLQTVLSESSIEVWEEKRTQLGNLARSYAVEPTADNMVRCCSWMHEAKDVAITTSVSSALPKEIDLAKSSLLAIDAENISFVVGRRSTRLRELDLSENMIGDSGAATVGNCVHNVDVVYLGECGLSSVGAKLLSQKIKDLRRPLKRLYIYDNNIGDAGAGHIGRCIHAVERVGLGECGITSLGVEKLTNKIRQLKTQLTSINLSWNRIGESGSDLLASCIGCMRGISLSGCGLKERAIELLSVKIKGLEKPLMQFDLSFNNIGDSSAYYIGYCIHNVEELDLSDNKLTSVGVRQLSEKIKVLKTPMRSLDLSKNPLLDKSAEPLAACVHNIGELNIEDCGMTQKGKDLIRSMSRGEVVT